MQFERANVQLQRREWLSLLQTKKGSDNLNQNQLERIRGNLVEIEKIIDEDTHGSKWVSDCLENLADQVIKELKSLVWAEYDEKWESGMKSAET